MKNRKYDHLILIGFGDIYKRALHFLIKVRSEYNYSLEVIENEPYPTSRIESICNENKIEYHKILDKKSLTEYLLSLEDKYAEDGISQRSLLISAGNKYIFPPKVISLSGLTVINFHNALLPKYPGRNAPSWAIYNGESEAGATWHLVTAAVDAGDILWQKACEITKDTKAYELTRNIMDLAYDGLTELLPLLLEGRSEAKKQEIKTTDRKIYYSKDTPANGIIRLTDSSAHVYRTLRAMDFGPNMIFQRPVLELQDGTRYSVKRYKKIPLIDKKDNEPAKCYYMTLDEEYVLKISVTEYVPGKIQTTFTPPEWNEYNRLRKAVGWESISKPLFEISFEKSIAVTLKIDGWLIAMARLVTDYAVIGLIVDVMVDPKYQKQGYGDMLVRQLLFLEKELLDQTDCCYVSVLASRGNDEFYKQMGFMLRPNLMLGPGMTMKIQGNKINKFEH